MKKRKTITRIVFIFSAFVIVSLLLCRCILLKERWSDSKASRIFQHKNVPLRLFDTVINGRHIHYAVCGEDDRPSLVFIHGSPGSWFHYMKFMWDEDMRRKYRIISFDRPGFGYSDFGKALHLADQCQLLLPVLQRLKTKHPMYLCGHSYGGAVVAKLAGDAPNLFDKVIITAGALDPGLEKQESWRQIMGKKPLFWFLPGAFQQSNTELLYLKEDLKGLAARLDKITTHIIFNHGDKDTWVPIENIAYGQKMMINAASITADTIKGADHQIPWNRRDDFKDILMRLK